MNIRSVIRVHADADADADENPREILSHLLGLMNAVYMLHRSLHWMSSKYDEHLLFQRLYGDGDGDGDVDISAEIDTLAEKMVETLGEASVSPVSIASAATEILSLWNVMGKDSLEVALDAETQLVNTLGSAYQGLKDMDSLSKGMDDFLLATANAHETHTYLLSQYARGRQDA